MHFLRVSPGCLTLGARPARLLLLCRRLQRVFCESQSISQTDLRVLQGHPP